MRAYRAIVETDEHGRLKDLPALPAHARIEAVFLVLDEPTAQSTMNRQPPASLAGVKILGDIDAPAFDEND